MLNSSIIDDIYGECQDCEAAKSGENCPVLSLLDEYLEGAKDNERME